VSAPTPKPAALGELPTRTSLRRPKLDGAAPAPAAAKAPEHVPAEAAPARVIPGAATGPVEPAPWEERVGPLGIFVSAVLACTLVWVLAIWLQLF
jgi:hypothetical protein